MLQPITIALIVAAFLIEGWPTIGSALAWPALDGLHWLALTAGYVGSVLLAFAAWRALFQLWRDPFRREKTDHRLGRRSRWRPDLTNSA